MNARESFQQLVRNLKLCPTLKAPITPRQLHETWAGFRRIDPEHGDEVTPAMLVALILYDEEAFADLITEAQLDQLCVIASHALQQYELAVKPPNQIGCLLAATIKESEAI